MAEQSEIVEKRIQRTVIRRRAVKVEEKEIETVLDAALQADVLSEEAPQGESPAAPLSGQELITVSPATTREAAGAKTVRSLQSTPGLTPEGTGRKPIILGTIDLSKTRPSRPSGVAAAVVDEEEKKRLLKKVVKKKPK